jgi:hypothetical protein
VRRKIQKEVDEIVDAAQEWGDYQDAPDGLVDQVRVLLDKTPALAWNDALLEIVDPG